MIIPTGFRETIDKCIEDNTGTIFKNFFDEENPRWEDLLKCIYSEIDKEDTKNFSEKEKPYGNVLLSHNIYLVSHLQREEIKEYFPKLINAIDVIRDLTGIGMQAIGPKGMHLLYTVKEKQNGRYQMINMEEALILKNFIQKEETLYSFQKECGTK
jgi:hypothetical protein